MFVCFADNNEIEEFLPTQIQTPLSLPDKLVSLQDLNILHPFVCMHMHVLRTNMISGVFSIVLCLYLLSEGPFLNLRSLIWLV